MPTRPKSWQQLAHTPPPALDRLRDEGLARFLREELVPFAPRLRARLDAAGLDPRRVRGLDSLAAVEPLGRDEWLVWQRAEPETPLLRPVPAGIRASWPFLRKLGLTLAGRRAAALLTRAYSPCLRLEAPGPGGVLAIALSSVDVDTLGESGARLDELADLGPPEHALVNAHAPGPSVEYWQTLFGALRSGRRAFHVGADPEAAARTIAAERARALAATPAVARRVAEAARASGHDLASLARLSLATSWHEPAPDEAEWARLLETFRAAGARDAQLRPALACAEARCVLSTCGDPATGYHLYPDLFATELLEPGAESATPAAEGADGELTLTTIAGHGTVLLRYRSGVVASGGLARTPCPHCARSLPRFLPGRVQSGS